MPAGVGVTAGGRDVVSLTRVPTLVGAGRSASPARQEQSAIANASIEHIHFIPVFTREGVLALAFREIGPKYT